MIVVTGATGNVGRPLTRALAEAGHQVTAVSRHTAEVPDGVSHLVGDLSEPAGLDPVLTGAKALFVLLSGDLHAAEARPADIIGRAAAAGVRRVVLLSSQGVATRTSGRTRITMRGVEDALRESGLEWAVLRPGASPPTPCGGPIPSVHEGWSPRPSAMSGCRSSTRRTSPMSRWPACWTTGTPTGCTS